MEAFQKSITSFATVGESIAQVSTTHCQSCGSSDAKPLMQCSGCKIIKYCSTDCQAKDWKEGHHDECAIIQEKLPWTALADEIMAGPPIPGSVIDRHLARFQTEEIGRPFGGGGFRSGFGGGGRGFRGGGFGGFRGAVRTPVGSVRLGLRGPGYSSRSLFRPRLGAGVGLRYRWGRGLGFGGYRWGFWGGWRFPWLFANGLWYPWWFYLDPVYYQMRRPYVDPLTGIAYGVPPYPPGTWGSVAAPPGGVAGYAEVPIAPGAGVGVAAPGAVPIFAAVDQSSQQQEQQQHDDLIDAPLRALLQRVKGRARGRRTFRRLMQQHTAAELLLADAKQTSAKQTTGRNTIGRQWVEAVSGVTGRIVQMLNDASLTKGKSAGELLVSIMADHDAVLVRVANGQENEAALDRFAQKWSEFWAAVSIDPVWITLNASGKSTLREVIASAPEAADAERILFADARRHSLAILSYMRGYETREECYDAAEAMGAHLDAYMSLSPHRHVAINMSVADIQAAWAEPVSVAPTGNNMATSATAAATHIEAQLKKGLAK